MSYLQKHLLFINNPPPKSPFPPAGGQIPGSSTQLASSVIVHFLRPFGSKRHSRALWRREKEPKRHHPPKALPQGRDATAPPVALLNRYARTIKGPAYILFFGAIYTMLKHQGASRTAGTHMAGVSNQMAIIL